MYAIRISLRGDHPSVPDTSVLSVSFRAVPFPGTTRVEELRVVPGQGCLDAVAFVAAPSLWAAEQLCRRACAHATSSGGPLPGWQLLVCGPDQLLGPLAVLVPLPGGPAVATDPPRETGEACST